MSDWEMSDGTVGHWKARSSRTGAVLEYVRGRTDGDIAWTTYHFHQRTIFLEFNVEEHGDPNKLKPAEAIFNFSGRVTMLRQSLSQEEVDEMLGEVVTGVRYFVDAVSGARIDYDNTRVEIRE